MLDVQMRELREGVVYFLSIRDRSKYQRVFFSGEKEKIVCYLRDILRNAYADGEERSAESLEEKERDRTFVS